MKAKPPRPRKKRFTLSTYILLGVVLGILSGILFGEYCAPYRSSATPSSACCR